MSVLLGFLGEPDSALLQQMDAALRRRASGERQEVIGPQSSLATRYQESHHRAVLRTAGVCQIDKFTFAAVGSFWGPAAPASLEELARRYQQQGPDFVQGLLGAFVMAIVDQGELHLFRDGAGARTLFYGRNGPRMLFAVEPKGIWQTAGFDRRLRPAAVAEYLSFSFIPGERTLLEGLHELPAGSRLQVKACGETRLTRYFRFEDFEPPDPGATEADWVRLFRETHRQAVADRLDLDRPAAVFLSGGLDSSVVTAELVQQTRQPVHSFAIHFGAKYPHELPFAREVAEHCGTTHHEVLIEPKRFLPRLREMIWQLDDVIGDPITMPNYELSAHVSQDFSAVFNGEGGDPLFGGPKNIPMLLHHWYGVPDRSKNFREQLYLESYRRGYDELSRLLSPEFRRQIDFEADLEQILTPYFQCEKPSAFLDKLMAINVRLKGAHLILPKVERMTGAWGVTPLSPLFDERLVRLAFQLPGLLKLQAGVEKIVIKKAYANDLPAAIINRPKSGMRVPVHFWFQSEMRKYARRILSPKAVRQAGIFDPARVKQLLDYNIEEGPGRYGLRLWMLLTFEIYRRMVFEGETV
ncbi:asparagine synthetase B family protein [Lignipirellula cremea]|uniref:asparagine synthase (glutamine-hydrolyzing) n=1 Tax=Lignipirellula cremea TaxID=2528010 RepID=A0A518DPQ5_9BACT|nr:asparagine synthase-related protein [Lignipirellula cremea]QDU93814.1 Asparagine synthetase [glutamine-hydrolyzing] 1 [Lignipirellula cremea]